MEKHCTNVYFLIKKARKDKNGESPIEAWVSVNGERTSYSTGKRIKLSEWDEKKQLVKGKSEKANLINEYLYQLRNKIFQKEIELMEKGFMITPSLLKDAVNDHVEAINKKTLLQIFNEYQEMRKPLIGKTIVKDTYDDNDLTGRYIKEYMKDKLHRKDIYLHEVKIGFIQGFHSFLLSVKNNRQNSCAKHLKFLKQLMNIAVANGHIQYNPLQVYKVEREKVEIDFLNDVELRKIINFDTPIKRFERTRDAFLFGCFTGLAYIDIKTLRKEHLETDSEGRIWIKKKRVKTGVLSRIPLLPMAKLLLEKYKDWPGDMIMPIQDATDVNENLKDIAVLCGINKRVTFHTSRHTFASTVTLANNISIEVISKMMGHTNTRMTSRYAKLVDTAIGEQMDKIKDEF
ncbi:MAG: site-specific integrase [Bacteroidaceae bacterium]|nr:site-specific integrase [Bacteroidaceae bacterium]